MKKFLSFVLVLGVFMSAQVFAQGEAQTQKNIYLYSGTVSLPNGKTYEAKFTIDEFGKMKVKLFDAEGREYKTYDTRSGGEFDPASLSTIFDIENRFGFGFVKREGQWKAVVFQLVADEEGGLQPKLHNVISLRDEKRVNLVKFSGQDHRGRRIESYFNPCDGQFVLTREGQNLMGPSYVISGNNFHKLVPQDKTQPNVYTYMVHWRDEQRDTNGKTRVGMNWESTNPTKIVVGLPKDDRFINPMDPRGVENVDSITLRAEGTVNFLDCLNQKYPDIKDRVTAGRTEVSEQSDCSDQNTREKLQEALNEAFGRMDQGIVSARDLDDF
ncbi:MAG: hypothetical protein HYY62_01705 [Deltaproteobacteria bacterium]|nr:hypothetical protein [Deltaproteobacteria bacterium]